MSPAKYSPSPIAPPIARLISSIDDAVDASNEASNEASICFRVKEALQDLVRNHRECLDARLTAPVAEGYGRRLLHRDPAGRYTVVIMTWAPGQGTPIHDHADLWCVECVERGKIRVVSFEKLAETDDGLVRFRKDGDVVAGVGEAGALIPPFDYHTIENPFSQPAVTIHVYGGEMERCRVFPGHDVDRDLYGCEERLLSYSA